MWAYTAASDPRSALAGAIYLGFPENASLDQLLTVSKPRKQERSRPDGPRRSLLQCLAFTPRGVDFTPVLEGLITQARPAHGTAQGGLTAAVAAVVLPPAYPTGNDASTPSPKGSAGSSLPSETSPVGSSGSVTLIVRSINEEQATSLLQRPTKQEELQRCDVALFIFDGAQPDSFRSTLEQMLVMASTSGDILPCVMVCLNEDQMTPLQVAEVGSACSALGIRPPLSFPQSSTTPGSPGARSSSAGAMRMVYQSVALAALRPEGAIPETPSLKATRQYRRMVRKAALIAAGGAVTGLIAYFAYRWVQGRDAGDESKTSDLRASSKSS